MKNHALKTSISTLLLLIVCTGCNRLDSVSPNAEIEPCLLKKRTYVKSFDTPPRTETFHYDDKNRLIKYGTDKNFSVIEYGRNGKISTVSKFYGSINRERYRYIWQNNTLLVINQIKEARRWKVQAKNLFEFNEKGNLINSTSYIIESGKWQEDMILSYSWKYENTIIIDIRSQTKFGWDNYSYKYIFDNNRNPISSFGLLNHFFYPFKNNLLETHDTQYENLGKERSLTSYSLYEYNEHGYPTREEVYLHNSLIDDIIYEYDCK